MATVWIGDGFRIEFVGDSDSPGPDIGCAARESARFNHIWPSRESEIGPKPLVR
jgi:hypothetical protein